MGVKVSFDPLQKIIQVTQPPVGGVVEIDAAIDLYSDAKEDWKNDPILNRYTFPFRTIGGDDLGSGLKSGSYFFLRNDLGWRIRPYEADHELRITGNLYAQDTTKPVFTHTLGSYNVTIHLTTSSLTQLAGGASPTDIASAVWNRLAAAPTAGSYGELVIGVDSKQDAMQIDITNILDIVTEIRKYGRNRTRIDPLTYQMHVYDDDGTTILRSFDLKNKDGVASILEIFERIPV